MPCALVAFHSLLLLLLLLLPGAQSRGWCRPIMSDKGKKARVEDEEQLDSELVLAIEKLQEVQDELEKVNEEASDKVLEVEQKYNEIRRPVYNKRNKIIQTIPDFWLTAFLSHPALSEFLTGDDQKVFKHLQSLDVEDFKDVKSGYTITFTFLPNPYFEDVKLVKVFRFSDEGTTSISGTQIRWKDGMDLTNGVLSEKQGSKRHFSDDSFFKWFSDTQQKDASDGTHDEVAEIIKEDLWPNPLKYFNNEADDDDEYEDDDDDEDEDEGEEEEEEEEEDDDDDVDEDQGKGANGVDDEDDEEDADDDGDDDDS